MKRFILHSYLKPEKVEEYVKLHAEPWPELVQLMTECNLHNYSISIRGTELYTYYEYTGEDYDADMRKMGETAVQQRWWQHSRPCFLYHEDGVYYDELKEIFYLA